MGDRTLSSKDLLAVLDASRTCSEVQDLAGFADAIVAVLPRLVGCDIASYNEIDRRAGGGFGRTNPADLFGADNRRLSESYDILHAYGHEHPLIPKAMSDPQLFPLAWSDVRTSAEIHRLHLYDLLYRSVKAEDQLAMVLEARRDAVVGITVDRSRPGYSHRDRAVLELFGCQLRGLRRLVAETQRLRAATTPLDLDEAAEGSVWTLKLFGGMELTGPAGAVHLAGKAAEVVKMLALAGGPVVVDQVIEELWTDVDPDVGRRRLRVLLHRLPHDASPLVVRRGEAVALGPSVAVDVTAFQMLATRALAAARKGDPVASTLGDRALALYRSDLLPEDPYSDRVAGPRERLRRTRLTLLDVLAAEAERVGNLTDAVLLLTTAVETDPFDEDRRLQLGWLYLSTGRWAAAFSVCEDARRAAAELGLRLSARWRPLLEALDPLPGERTFVRRPCNGAMLR